MKRKHKKIIKKVLPHTPWVILGLVIIFQFVNAHNLEIQVKNSDFTIDLADKYIVSLEALGNIGKLDSQHIHADFAMFIEGEFIDFNKPEYTVDEFLSDKFWESKHNKLTHMHGGDDNTKVIHVHATGITFQHFFHSIGIDIDESCLTTNEKERCSNNGERLRFYLNGIRDDFAIFKPIQDLDKLFVTFGSETQEEIDQQLAQTGERACISSKNCE